jgi:hypothetical protein
MKTYITLAMLVSTTVLLILATTMTNTAPAFAKITSQTTCDGEPGECPGSSSGPGRGHDEETENVNPTGKAPSGQNK